MTAAIALAALSPWLAAQAEDPQRPQVAVLRYRESRQGGLLLVEAMLEGRRKGVFVLDTGSNASVLFGSVVRELGLKVRPAVQADGTPLRLPDGKPAVEVTLSRFSLDDVTYENEDFFVLEDRRLRPLLGEAVDGIIGAYTLLQSVLALDFDRKWAIVVHQGPAPPGLFKAMRMPGAVPIRLVDPQKRLKYSVTARLGESRTESLLVDTGAAQTQVTLATAARLGVLPSGLPRTPPGLFAQETRVFTGRLPSLSVGEHTVQDLEVRFPEKDGADEEPLLGLDFLSRFRVVMDFVDEKLYLAPREDPGGKPPGSSPRD